MKRGRVYNRVYSIEEWNLVNKENKNIMEDFLEEYKQRKKSKGTIDQYRNDLRIFFIYIKQELCNKCILDLKKKDFRRYNLWCQEKGMSNARVNRLMSACRSMLTYCEDDDEYDYEVNISSKVKGLPKEEVREIYFLTETQISKLRNHLKEKEQYQKMLLLDLAYDSAGRRNELLQVLKDGLLDKNSTNVVVGKRGKKFPLIYFSRTKESLNLWLEQRGDDNIASLWVVGRNENKRPASYENIYDWFVSMANILETIDDDAPPFNAHTLRHSALENLSNGEHYILSEIGKDKLELNELKVYAHHSDVSTTSSYLKNDENGLLEQTFGITIK